VEVRAGDGSAGAPDRAPFGGISVTAAATTEPPRELFEQLAPGAALVCPVRRPGGEDLMRFRDGVAQAVVPVRFVPLVPDEPEPEGGEEPA
jgi:protein-L-isoaspartate(D-aspartate) O-methyltransferase